MSIRACFTKLKDLEKTEERIIRANEMYRHGDVGVALDLVGTAFTSLALAYRKNVINTDDWKELSRALRELKEVIESEESIAKINMYTDSAVDTIKMIMFEKLGECLGVPPKRGVKPKTVKE